MDQRSRLCGLSHPKRSNTLWPVDLVGGYGNEVWPVAKVDPSQCLHRVRQHHPAHLVYHFRNRGQRLADADFIIDHHHRNQEHALVQFALEQVEFEPALPLDGKDGQVDALLCQPLAGVQNRGMLGRNRYDPVAALSRFLDRALQSPVQRLGRAAGERDAAALEPHRFLDLLARDFDRRSGLMPPARRGMGICELLLDPGLHRPRDFGRDRRRCLVIQVDHAACAEVRATTRPHSSRKASTSTSLVAGPKLMRRKPAVTSAGTSIASNTWLFFIFPEEHALPAETAKPARSNWTSSDALDAPGSDIDPIVGIRGEAFSTITPPPAATPSSRRCRSFAIRSMS